MGSLVSIASVRGLPAERRGPGGDAIHVCCCTQQSPSFFSNFNGVRTDGETMLDISMVPDAAAAAAAAALLQLLFVVLFTQ